MTEYKAPIGTLDDLRAFVEASICERNQLILGGFPLRESLLVRHGKPCGVHFTLQGPRAVQYSAIWDPARRTVLFYDCNGGRFYRSDLMFSEGLQNELSILSGVVVMSAA